MKTDNEVEYETYKEIMSELMNPILVDGLDHDTLHRLYKSKLVYLENLRVKCFRAINGRVKSLFTQNDYRLIVEAIAANQEFVKMAVLVTINNNLAKRKIS
jgi:hypothetical protein